MYDLASTVSPYGSIRIGVGMSGGGEVGVANNAPRVGLNFKHSIFSSDPDKFKVIGRIEWGLNLVSRDETVQFTPDPGAQFIQVGDAVFTRLGYLGLAYNDFSITFGKSNSIYYTLVASEVDRFLAFGGSAIGVWNAGTDGGVSGTGRANQAIILKYEGERFSLGAQSQVRNVSPESQKLDTYGFAGNYHINDFALGLGYNKILDGVDDPLPNQAMDGDEAFLVSTSYTADRYELAFAYSVFSNHEVTNDIFYDGQGMELFAKYKFSSSRKWHVASGFNYREPDSDENLGDFKFLFCILELGYNFKKSSYISANMRIDGSEDMSGSRLRENIYGLGIRFGF